jgi:hypothetical protein
LPSAAELVVAVAPDELISLIVTPLNAVPADVTVPEMAYFAVVESGAAEEPPPPAHAVRTNAAKLCNAKTMLHLLKLFVFILFLICYESIYIKVAHYMPGLDHRSDLGFELTAEILAFIYHS